MPRAQDRRRCRHLGEKWPRYLGGGSGEEPGIWGPGQDRTQVSGGREPRHLGRTQLDLSVFGEQHILPLDVTMNHLVRVQMGQALQECGGKEISQGPRCPEIPCPPRGPIGPKKPGIWAPRPLSPPKVRTVPGIQALLWSLPLPASPGQVRHLGFQSLPLPSRTQASGPQGNPGVWGGPHTRRISRQT